MVGSVLRFASVGDNEKPPASITVLDGPPDFLYGPSGRPVPTISNFKCYTIVGAIHESPENNNNLCGRFVNRPYRLIIAEIFIVGFGKASP